MKATDILVEEHRLIKKVLDCLDKMVAEAEEKRALNLSAAEMATNFLYNFADLCHHSKEEDRLFPVMEENGFPRDGGPTGVMMMDHMNGRNCVNVMKASIEKASEGDEVALNAFKDNVQELRSLLMEHIQKEDHCLFSMADNALSDEAKNGLLGDFRRIESEAGGKRHAQYIQVVKDLCHQYDVECVSEDELKIITEEFLTA